ncbi:hypothetical protein J6T93_00850 [bacterium]|nr:hypothetical protein [bacterium]
MKLVAFPNTPQKQVFAVTGPSATFGSSPDNPIYLEGPNVSDYQASLTYSDGVWLLESLDEKKIQCGSEASSSLKLKVGLKFSLAGVDFLVLDVIMTEAKAPSEPEQPQQMQPPPGGALQVMPNGMQQQGYQVAVGGQQWGMAAPGTFVDPYAGFVVQASDTLAKLGLIFSILGPLVLGVGELIGLVLCVISISRRRNTVRGTIMAWIGVVLSLVWLIIIGLGLFYFMTKDTKVHNETKVVARLEKTVMAEYYVKYAVLVDDDGNLIGEFVEPDRFAGIAGIDVKAKELAESPLREGYNYYFENVSADTFTITATPQVYNVTGKKTYWVNETGIIVSEDLKGSRFEDDPLSKIEDMENVQTIPQRYEKELSEKLLFAAEQNFKNEKYDLCQQIIENLKNKFPYSSAMAKLNAVEKENAPFLMEAKAHRLYSDAMNYVKSGRKDPALETLRNIAADFPNTSTAQEAKNQVNALALELASAELALANAYIESNFWNAVEESLGKIEQKYPEAFVQGDFKDKVSACRKLSHDLRDQYAMNLLKSAENLELAGDNVQAYNAYLQIRESYGNTPAAKDIDAALARLNTQMNEKTAEKYIADIMKNVAMSNEVVVVNMISLLKNSCGETKAYKRAEEILERIRKNCTVSVLSKEVDKFMEEKNYQSAKDRLEHIIKEKPESFMKIKDKLELCLVNNFDTYYAKGDFDEALEAYERYMDMNPILPAIDRGKVDECCYKSGVRLYQQGDMRDAADKFEKCYPAYLKDNQYNFIAGRANAVIKHWEPAARHLIACKDIEDRYKFDLCTARAYSIVNLSMRQENRLIAMFVANLDFQETIRDYKWIKINYAKLSVTNDIENVSNVLMKIDREKTSGEVVVTLQRPEPDAQKQNASATASERDKLDMQESLLNVDRSYQKSLMIINDRIRELEQILNEIIRTNGSSKHIVREKFKKQIDRFNLRIKELEIIDKREMKANEDILKQIDRDIAHHNAVRADLKAILEKRNVPELGERLVSVSKKIEELKKVNRMFRKFFNDRNLRNAKIDLFLKSIVDSAEKETLTPEQLSEGAVKIRGYYTNEDKTYIECVRKFTESLNIDIDLSSLEEFLPKDKSEANKAKAEAEAAAKAQQQQAQPPEQK